MNKKQWITFIIGISSVLICWASVAGNKPRYGYSSFFWYFTSYKGGGHHVLNFGPFLLLLLIVLSVFATIIWAVRTKKVTPIKIEEPEIKEKMSSEKDFIAELKELVEMREKGLISEEEFQKAKKKLFEE